MQPAELSIDLDAQELLNPTTPPESVEVEDISCVAPVLEEVQAEAISEPTSDQPIQTVDDESVEIELTLEQMEAMLTPPASQPDGTNGQ